MNDKGEIIVKPTSKLKNIGTIHGDVFTYNNGDGWGLMNVKGETLIRAKYEFLYYDEDGTLIALVKNGDTYEYKYIDQQDNQIGEDSYVKATLFSMFDGKHALVKPNDKIYSIIDKNGKQLENLPDIVDIGTYEGESYIESDYVDINKMIAGFNISPDGLYGFNYQSTPQQAVNMEVKQDLAIGDKQHKAGTPYWYDFKDNIMLYGESEGINGWISIQYSGNLSRQTYKTKRVIDYDFGDYYWYHDDKIPTGYVWNKVRPTLFGLTIYNGGRMHGKLRTLFNALSQKVKSWGKVVKENNGAAIVNLNNGKRAIITMEKDKVSVFWGQLKAAKDIDISKYKDACEEDDLNNISYGYLNDLFSDEVAADTAVVESDSTAVE